MPEGESSQLRIFCICGQKMKVSGKMYGLPGKCVVCRQKIRIPRRDEVPQGVTDIYLRDYPEFLRKPGHPAALVDDESDATPHTPTDAPEIRSPRPNRVKAPERKALAPGAGARAEVPLGEVSERMNAAPLDTFEPLRNLCSVRHKLERQLAAMEDDDASRQQRTELKRHLSRLKHVRHDLDEQLRQVLMEVAIELASTHEKIAQTGLEARVGEVPFDRYRDTIDRSRRRRDRLERRQHNLRGWLATSDPHMAGGYIEIPLDSVPLDGFTVSVPSDPEETDPLVNIHANALRDALYRHAQAGRKLAEIRKMESGEPHGGKGLRDAKADCKAERIIAEATIAFCRERLQQLQSDCQGDVESADAQLDLLRGRLQIGEIDRVQYDAMERQLVRAKVDAVKARAVAGGAVRARSAQEVPHPKGTFLARLALRSADSKNGLDQWIAWAAALIMALSVFFPAMNGLSLVSAFFEFSDNSIPARWAFLGPILYGASVALAAGLPKPHVRGAVIALLWATATLWGAWTLHQAQFNLDPLAARFRTGPAWALRPGMLLLILGDVAVAAAAMGAVLSDERARRWPLGVLAVATAGVFAIFTNGLGLFVPRLTLDAVAGKYTTLEGTGDPVAAQRWTVSAFNEGRRTLQLLGNNSQARAAYTFLLEKKAGANSWLPVEWQGVREGNYGQLAAISPGEDASFEVLLPAGEYRVLAKSGRGNEEETAFAVVARESEQGAQADGAPPAEVAVAPEPEAEADGAPANLTQAVPNDTAGYEVELKGVLTAANGAMTFTLAVRAPDAAEQRTTLTIGEELRQGWTLSQYNPQLRTVTLSGANGRLLTLRRGEPVSLQ